MPDGDQVIPWSVTNPVELQLLMTQMPWLASGAPVTPMGTSQWLPQMMGYGETGIPPATPQKTVEDVLNQLPTEEEGFPEWEMPAFPTETPPSGYQWVWDSSIGQYVLNPIPQTAYPQPTEVPTDPYGRRAVWDADNAEWRYPPDWGVDPVTQQAGYISPYQQWQMDEARRQMATEQSQQAWQQQLAQQQLLQERQQWLENLAWQREEAQRQQTYQQAQLAWQREQEQMQQALASQQFQAQLTWQQQLEAQRMQQEQQQWQESLTWQREQAQLAQQEQERQYRAGLAAQPISWLEYSSYTGQPPAVQPWQLPLSYPQYGWQVGEQIPGWTPQSGAGMPELQSPAHQYYMRMGPTSQAQWLGYEQARTGARPEESLYRLQSTAPPSGAYTPLRWAR